ncbi:hypothetical protein RRG08_033446 [Elysia crispata]|uniref:Uncharacterized protein n=1 Tax=Elysia crispata TaxID=231223 RepID=A0AAE1ATT0_9GAST|nr:hypothetical protein RRG08_033446 [Elysia crispata]
MLIWSQLRSLSHRPHRPRPTVADRRELCVSYLVSTSDTVVWSGQKFSNFYKSWLVLLVETGQNNTRATEVSHGLFVVGKHTQNQGSGTQQRQQEIPAILINVNTKTFDQPTRPVMVQLDHRPDCKRLFSSEECVEFTKHFHFDWLKGKKEGKNGEGKRGRRLL